VATGPQPFLNEPEDALVADPVLRKRTSQYLKNFRERSGDHHRMH
jgi:hypothetical protein